MQFIKNKCVFLAPSVEYLGYVIDEKGLHPTQEKVRVVQDTTNVAELKLYLGHLTLLQVFEKLVYSIGHTQPAVYHEYTIEWRASKQHAYTDALSHLPSPEALAETVVPAELGLMVENMAESK